MLNYFRSFDRSRRQQDFITRVFQRRIKGKVETGCWTFLTGQRQNKQAICIYVDK